MNRFLRNVRSLSTCRKELFVDNLNRFLAKHDDPNGLFLATGNPQRGILTSSDSNVANKRVLGVIAHINSGKTTTSEAMLFASGALRRMGNVDVGDTAMDYLPAERERGITVASAAISFQWQRHHLFLVDSPGHLDFTYEVERALRAMDAAVVVLDAVAGVQPQSETVWRQADTNRLSRIVFINKMDRDGADFPHVVADISRCFGATPLITQVPLFDGPRFKSVYNILDYFSDKEESPILPGDAFTSFQREKIEHAANALVEACADFDDNIMAAWVEGKPISRTAVVAAVRSACINGWAVPVLCGASLRGIGVKHLLDAIVSYFPSPTQRRSLCALPANNVNGNSVIVSPELGAPFLAYAYKVTHDKHRGRLVYLRAFSGHLPERMFLLNTKTGKKEQPTRLLRVLADKFEDIDSVSTGDIFAAVGLKHTTTGDTIMVHGTPKRSQFVLDGVRTPPAVFAVAVAPEFTADETELEAALKRLIDEDASLELRYDNDTGETLLAGMGELHLEVAIDHMRRKLPFPIQCSQPRVAYREQVTRTVTREYSLDTVIGSTRLSASLTVEVAPRSNVEDDKDLVSNVVSVSDTFPPELLSAAHEGATAALGRGPIIGAAVTATQVTIRSLPSINLNMARTDVASVCTCANRAVQIALRDADPILLEPVMQVDASVPSDSVGDIVAELSHPTRRRGTVVNVVHASDIAKSSAWRSNQATVSAIVPVDGLIGWTNRMRSITKGRGDLQMTFAEYRPVDQTRQNRIVADGLR